MCGSTQSETVKSKVYQYNIYRILYELSFNINLYETISGHDN